MGNSPVSWSDSERVLAVVGARGGRGGVPLPELLVLVDRDRDRLDRALAALDERGLINVLGSVWTHDARAVATPAARDAARLGPSG